MHLTGSCHCGVQKISFETHSSLAPRACQCRFCRKHGARTVTDPGGSAALLLGPDVRYYRFATRTTDYVLCGRCGVYLGAVAAIGDGTFSTLNLNAFDDPRLDLDAEPVSYEGETADQKRARRALRWTPTILRER